MSLANRIHLFRMSDFDRSELRTGATQYFEAHRIISFTCTESAHHIISSPPLLINIQGQTCIPIKPSSTDDETSQDLAFSISGIYLQPRTICWKTTSCSLVLSEAVASAGTTGLFQLPIFPSFVIPSILFLILMICTGERLLRRSPLI